MKRLRNLYRRLRRRPYIRYGPPERLVFPCDGVYLIGFGDDPRNRRRVHGKEGEPIPFFAEGDSVTPITWLTDAVGSDPHPRPAASAESQEAENRTGLQVRVQQNEEGT